MASVGDSHESRPTKASRHDRRQTTACIRCRQRKRRCDGNRPCSLCRSRDLICDYSALPDGRHKRHSRPLDGFNPGIVGTSLLPSSEGYRPSLSLRPNEGLAGNPGRLSFKLRLGEDRKLRYRGSNSSNHQGDGFSQLNPQSSSTRNAASSRSTDFQFFLPDRTQFQRHMAMFVEWQNSSVIILAQSVVDELLLDYDSLRALLSKQLLIMSILALTTIFTQLKDDTPSSSQYTAKAREVLTKMAFEAPCIEVIQSACILACREYGQGLEDAAWLLNSIAASVGNILGVNISTDQNRWLAQESITQDYAEVRKIIHSANFVIDKALANCFGYTGLVTLTSYDTTSLHLSKERTSTEELQSFGMTPEPSNSQGSPLETLYISVKLWEMNGRMLDEVRKFQHDIETIDKQLVGIPGLAQHLNALITKFNNELSVWYQGLPGWISRQEGSTLSHVLLFEMAYHNHIIQIHGPLLNVKSRFNGLIIEPKDTEILEDLHEVSMARCMSSACTILKHVGSYATHHTLKLLPPLGMHYILTASMIHSMNIASDDVEISSEAGQALALALDSLEEISTAWKMAKKIINIIKARARGVIGDKQEGNSPVLPLNGNSSDSDNQLCPPPLQQFHILESSMPEVLANNSVSSPSSSLDDGKVESDFWGVANDTAQEEAANTGWTPSFDT